MLRANELSNPGERNAQARVEALFERLDELPRLAGLVVPTPALPTEERDELVAEVESLARRLGLRELLDDARDHARDRLLARYASEGRAWMLHEATGRSSDEVMLVVAVGDAVAVAVVEDHLDPARAETLAGPGRRILGIGGEPSHGFEQRPGEPSAEDWAEAADGLTMVDPEASSLGSGSGGRRMAFGGLAVVLTPAALFLGVATGDLGPGLIAAVAVILVCWTLASRPTGG
jgi:hypothetical protein